MYTVKCMFCFFKVMQTQKYHLYFYFPDDIYAIGGGKIEFIPVINYICLFKYAVFTFSTCVCV